MSLTGERDPRFELGSLLFSETERSSFTVVFNGIPHKILQVLDPVFCHSSSYFFPPPHLLPGAGIRQQPALGLKRIGLSSLEVNPAQIVFLQSEAGDWLLDGGSRLTHPNNIHYLIRIRK